jgi:hypothetical protein
MLAARVATNEAYGDNGAFRAGIAALGLDYVVAISCTHRVPAFRGGRRRLHADHITATCPPAPGTPSAPEATSRLPWVTSASAYLQARVWTVPSAGQSRPRFQRKRWWRGREPADLEPRQPEGQVKADHRHLTAD